MKWNIAPLCQISQACAVPSLSCLVCWWLQRWGSDPTDPSHPLVWEAEPPTGSLVQKSQFFLETENPAHPRTTHRDPLLLHTEPAQTRLATFLHFHPAVIPPPDKIIHHYYWWSTAFIHTQVASLNPLQTKVMKFIFKSINHKLPIHFTLSSAG